MVSLLLLVVVTVAVDEVVVMTATVDLFVFFSVGFSR